MTCRTWMLAAVLALVCWAGAAEAQPTEDRQIAFGKEIFKSKATCLFCHRWDGNGDQGYGGLALSLRKTKLDHDQLVMTIRCGRIGTGMPYHDQFAYTDTRCYGLTREQVGGRMPPQAVNFLAMREVQAVVAFLEAHIIGKGPATLDDCLYFWGTETRECDSYKQQAAK